MFFRQLTYTNQKIQLKSFNVSPRSAEERIPFSPADFRLQLEQRQVNQAS